MPPAAAAPPDVFYRGALRARLVAPLAGTTPNQLAAWHRRSILTSSFIKGRRGVPRLYSWIDYQKARALVALIEQGIQRRRLGPQIAALDAEVDEWWKLSLLAYSNYVIVPRDDAPGYTIIEKQGAMDDLIRDAPLRAEDVSADDAKLAIEVIRVLRAEGPLGRLAEYRGVHRHGSPHPGRPPGRIRPSDRNGHAGETQRVGPQPRRTRRPLRSRHRGGRSRARVRAGARGIAGC